MLLQAQAPILGSFQGLGEVPRSQSLLSLFVGTCFHKNAIATTKVVTYIERYRPTTHVPSTGTGRAKDRRILFLYPQRFPSQEYVRDKDRPRLARDRSKSKGTTVPAGRSASERQQEDWWRDAAAGVIISKSTMGTSSQQTTYIVIGLAAIATAAALWYVTSKNKNDDGPSTSKKIGGCSSLDSGITSTKFTVAARSSDASTSHLKVYYVPFRT